MFQGKFRSTGLEEQAAPLLKKKDTDKDIKDKDLKSGKRPLPASSSASLSKSLPDKKRPSLSIPTNNSTGKSDEASPNKTSPPVVEALSPGSIHSAIKIIPPKPQKVMHESSDFMAALIGPAASQPIRKKKKLPSKPNTPTTPTSPPNTKKDLLPPPGSFYKDTLEMDEEKERSSTPTPDDEKSNDSNENKDEEKENNSEKAKEEASGENGDQSGGRKKKRVTWAKESEIKKIYYFEMDETERVNVNRVRDFGEMKKQEMCLDKQAMINIRHNNFNHSYLAVADKMEEHISWYRPKLISDLPPRTVEFGANSTEKEAQRKRESSVLQALYFNKDMVPDSAAEADPETNTNVEEPKIIPVDDEAGDEYMYQEQTAQQNNFPPTSMNFPTTSVPELPPNLAQLLNSITGGGTPNGNAPTSEASGPPQDPSMASLPPDMASILGALANQTQMPQDANMLGNVNGLIKSLMEHSPAAAGMSPPDPNNPDQLTDKLRQILEPFKDQLQQGYGNFDMNGMPAMPPPMGFGPPPPGMMPPPGMEGMMPPPPFGMPPGFMPGPDGPMPPFMMDGPGGPPMRYPPGGPPPNMRGRGPPPRGGYGPPPPRGRGPPPPQRGRGAPRGGRPSRWDRSRDDVDRNSVCRNFVATGQCRFGAECRFMHPPP